MSGVPQRPALAPEVPSNHRQAGQRPEPIESLAGRASAEATSGASPVGQRHQGCGSRGEPNFKSNCRM